ncbi:MAG: alpha/beta hydrolase, partial [Lactobacillus johnsonii]|nr:alpha/beta hydrolase [Lactobacillus johnsonii]
PESSVAAGKYIFQNQVKHYTTMTVTGSDAQHSSLPQNKQVVQLIKQYLLENNSGNNIPVNGQKLRENNKKK